MSIISNIKSAYKLYKKVDVSKMLSSLSTMDENQINSLLKMMTSSGHKQRELPPIDGDFYHLGQEALKDEDRELQLKVRAF
jgi:glutaryl-CoA dehydrogenase